MARSWPLRGALMLAGVAGILMGPRVGRSPAQERGRGGLTASEFQALYRKLHIENFPWATIPWKVSVTEARDLAARTRKPIFMLVNTGNCLGFV